MPEATSPATDANEDARPTARRTDTERYAPVLTRSEWRSTPTAAPDARSRAEQLHDRDGRRRVADAYVAYAGLVESLGWARGLIDDGAADLPAVVLITELLETATAILADAGLSAERDDRCGRLLLRKDLLIGHADLCLQDAALAGELEEAFAEIRHLSDVLGCDA